uniref:VWFA domain-containing protein n=1 Tax=Strongyloides venezuelensis TaxID=75913 RepID=A0A0K0FK11_STRVS
MIKIISKYELKDGIDSTVRTIEFIFSLINKIQTNGKKSLSVFCSKNISKRIYDLIRSTDKKKLIKWHNKHNFEKEGNEYIITEIKDLQNIIRFHISIHQTMSFVICEQSLGLHPISRSVANLNSENYPNTNDKEEKLFFLRIGEFEKIIQNLVIKEIPFFQEFIDRNTFFLERAIKLKNGLNKIHIVYLIHLNNKTKTKGKILIFKINNNFLNILSKSFYYKIFTQRNDFIVFLRNITLKAETNKGIYSKNSFTNKTINLVILNEFPIKKLNIKIYECKKNLQNISAYFKEKSIITKPLKDIFECKCSQNKILEDKHCEAITYSNYQQVNIHKKIDETEKKILQLVRVFNEKKEFLTRYLKNHQTLADKHNQILTEFIVNIIVSIDMLQKRYEKDIQNIINSLNNNKEQVIKIVRKNCDKIKDGKILAISNIIEQDQISSKFKNMIKIFSNSLNEKNNKYCTVAANNIDIINTSTKNLQKANVIGRNAGYIITCRNKIDRLTKHFGKSEIALKLKNVLDNLESK